MAGPLPWHCCWPRSSHGPNRAWRGSHAAAAGSQDAAWRRCAALSGDNAARLACFDAWAGQQAWQALPLQPWQAQRPAAATAQRQTPTPRQARRHHAAATRIIDVARTEGCRDPQYSDLSRFWELESGSDCGTFSFRGYRPSPCRWWRQTRSTASPRRPPLATRPQKARPTAPPKTASSCRCAPSWPRAADPGHPTLKDSVWFGYSQQSYWQLFTPQISRPFRSTDHEPEIMYVYPTTAQLPFGWRWRYSGVGLVHQSNGQSNPLSRSWNRVYLMTGMELDNRWTVTGRLWKRLSESADSDDNPGISDYVGRGELSVRWNVNKDNTLGATFRSSLASSDRGSVRLEWMQALGSGLWGGKSNLRLHTALFSGYGDSMIDYNRKRTVFSLGVSLVDF